jgi:hypothetical protein
MQNSPPLFRVRESETSQIPNEAMLNVQFIQKPREKQCFFTSWLTTEELPPDSECSNQLAQGREVSQFHAEEF